MLGAFVEMLLLRPALHRHTDFFHKWGVLATCTSDDAPTALVFSSEGYRNVAIDVVAVKWDTTERSFLAKCTLHLLVVSFAEDVSSPCSSANVEARSFM